jgi:hypothetical protein
LKQTIAICAGVLALGLAGSAPAMAQLVYPAYPIYPGYAAMPPSEVVAIVRAAGMRPLSPPLRYGPTYMLRALDPAGQEVRVVVHARSGRIVRVAPMFGPRYAGPIAPPPYGPPPGRIVQAPDGSSPNPRIAALPPALDVPPGYGPGPGYDGLPGSRAPAAQAPAPGMQAGPPPLPRPRPKVASTDSSDAKPATVAAPPAAPATAKPTKDVTGTIGGPARAAPAPAEVHE